jgi:hypothetical protein
MGYPLADFGNPPQVGNLPHSLQKTYWCTSIADEGNCSR